MNLSFLFKSNKTKLKELIIKLEKIPKIHTHNLSPVEHKLLIQAFITYLKIKPAFYPESLLSAEERVPFYYATYEPDYKTLPEIILEFKTII